MPSPFPGMDPYLEGSQWPSVHTQLSVEIARQLAPRLRPRYVVRTPRRFVISTPDALEDVTVSAASVYPDVSVSRANAGAPPAGATAIATPPLQMMTLMPEAVPQITIEIRAVDNQQLVTAIEVLSPTNKRGEGRDEYLSRRRKFLLSTAHLMEIDLLRQGRRPPMAQPLPDEPYFVFLSRAQQRPKTDVWPISLQQKLPTVPIPLLDGDADVPLDLQQAFTQVYDAFGYDLEQDYSKEPEVPLQGEQRTWAEERLRRHVMPGEP